MSRKKNVPIKYTSRDFESIKTELVDHARRYYSDVYKDFSAASFGSLVLDTVSYVGDVLSFYLDYQANESFMDTSIEAENVRRHAKNLGYEYFANNNSFGIVTLYVVVPSNSDGSAPDFSYLPILKTGSTFKSSNNAEYTLTEDVDFNNPKNDIVAARFDTDTGATTSFAIRAFGQVVSGQLGRVTLDLTADPFEKFKRVRLGGSDITEVIQVTDNEGNLYFQVDNLAQEVVFLETTNRNAFQDGVPSILKPFVAARRFVLEQDNEGTFLQFGNGSELLSQTTGLLEPTRVGMKLHGRRNLGSLTFDPTHLANSGKLGICPSGKELTVILKTNPFTEGYTSPPNTVTQITGARFEFENQTLLDALVVQGVIDSLEVSNEEVIIGSNRELTKDEIKQRARSHHAAQRRAVTAIDYESLAYTLPPQFGTIRRCKVVNDPSSASRRISMYVVSEDENKSLVATNSTIKNNLKRYLQIYRSLNDVLDIFDAKIINFGIEFHVVTSPSSNSNDVISSSIMEIIDLFSDQLFIGEPLYLTDIYRRVNRVSGVVDVKNIKINIKSGGVYSGNTIDLDEIMSRDGTFFKTPKNVVFELKYPQLDIKGVVK